MEMQILNFILAVIENIVIFVFADRLLQRKFKNPFVCLVAVLLCSGLMIFFFDLNICIKSLLSIVQLMASFIILYKDTLLVKFGLVATSLYLLYISDIVIGNIFTIVLDEQLYNVFFSDLANRIVICLLIKLINAFIFFMVYKMFSKINLNLAKKKWVLYDIIVGVFLIISVLFIYMYSFAETDFPTSVTFVGISTAFFIMSIIVIYFFTEICSSFQQEKRLYEMQASLNSMQNIITLQSQTNIKLQKIRHDMKKHILSVAQLWDSEKSEEAHKLLLQTAGFVNDIGFQLSSSTGNALIDAKISSVAAKCETMGIDFSYKLEPLPELKISLLDLSALLSNIFDNAVEASEKVDTPKIEAKIFIYKDYVCINICNSFLDRLDTKNGSLSSTKTSKNEHGYGTQIINEICDKYGGTFTWNVKDSQFIANAILVNK